MSDLEQHPAEVSIERFQTDDEPRPPEQFSSMLIPHHVWEEDGRRIIGFGRIEYAAAIRVTAANGETLRFVRDMAFSSKGWPF